MIIDIPRKHPFYQANKGDVLGTIYSSRNINFEINEGKVSPSQKVLTTTLGADNVSDNPQAVPEAFAYEDGTVNTFSSTYFWCASGTKMYESGTENGEFNYDDSATGTPTLSANETDIKSFNGKLYVASDVNLWRRTSGAYTSISSTLNGGRKILCTYGERLYIMVDDLEIISMDVSETLAVTGATYTLDLRGGAFQDQYMTSMRPASNGIWITTMHRRGGRANVIFWDGVTADTVEFSKTLPSGMAMGLTIKDDLPYVLDNLGILSKYNGSYFKEVGRFHMNHSLLFQFNNVSKSTRWLHPNGIQTIGDEILMNINSRPDDPLDTENLRIPSGVHAYNEKFGIYHKHSFGPQKNSATVTEQGQVKISQAGALFSMMDNEDNEDMDDIGRFMVGAEIFTNASTTDVIIGVHDARGEKETLAKVGMITTTQIQADEVQESWEKFYTLIKPMDTSTDKIVAKYRTREYSPIYADITWVNTTSFTTTDTDFASIKTNFDSETVSADYEVEVMCGDGGGMYSHITAITETGGTYTVTVDETHTGATTNTANVRVDRWDRLGEVTDDDEMFKSFNPEAVSTWIQYRAVMYGVDVEIDRLLSKSSINQPL